MTEILLFIGLGYVVLGPQRMHVILQKVARAKREFDKTRSELSSQLEAHCGREPVAEIPSPPRRTRDPLA